MFDRSTVKIDLHCIALSSSFVLISFMSFGSALVSPKNKHKLVFGVVTVGRLLSEGVIIEQNDDSFPFFISNFSVILVLKVRN